MKRNDLIALLMVLRSKNEDLCLRRERKKPEGFFGIGTFPFSWGLKKSVCADMCGIDNYRNEKCSSVTNVVPTFKPIWKTGDIDIDM